MKTATSEKTSSQPRLNYAAAAPATLQAMLALVEAVKHGGLDEILLYLVETRASQINGCGFCIDMHIRAAKAAGQPDERLYLLDAWRDVDIYSPRERAALRWTELLTRLTENEITEADFAAARREFSEAELSHLTLAIVTINGWNRFNVAFRMPPRFGG